MVLLKSLINCLCAISLTIASPISNRNSLELVHSKSVSESYSLSNSSSVLKKELQSIMMVEHLDNSTTTDEDHKNNVLLIPRHQITEKIMNGLGFKGIVKHSKKFKLSNQAFDSQLEIMVPEGTTPFFLFNTTDPLKIPTQKTRAEYANFIDHSIPFELPEFTSLIDYYLVFPIPSGFDKKSLHDGILLTSRFKLPIFRHALKENNPLLVFMFRSGNSVFEAKEHNIPLMKIKNYMGNQDLNLFFDIFAKEWISSVSYSQLIHSIFCTVNTEAANQSYCINIKKDMNNLGLFPAYNGLKKHFNKNHKRADEHSFEELSEVGTALYTGEIPDVDINDLVKRETSFNSKSSSREQSSEDSFQELTLPLSIIKDNDEASVTSVDSYSPRAKGYTQVLTKLKTTRQRLQSREAANHNAKGYDSKDIEALKETLEHRLKQKNGNKKVKDNSNAFVTSKATKDDERKLNEQGKRVKKVFKTKNKVLEEEEEAKVRQKQTNDTVREIKNFATKDSSNKEVNKVEEKEECVPITWVNVFHQSLFGKQNFCGV